MGYDISNSPDATRRDGVKLYRLRNQAGEWIATLHARESINRHELNNLQTHLDPDSWHQWKQKHPETWIVWNRETHERSGSTLALSWHPLKGKQLEIVIAIAIASAYIVIMQLLSLIELPETPNNRGEFSQPTPVIPY